MCCVVCWNTISLEYTLGHNAFNHSLVSQTNSLLDQDKWLHFYTLLCRGGLLCVPSIKYIEYTLNLKTVENPGLSVLHFRTTGIEGTRKHTHHTRAQT